MILGESVCFAISMDVVDAYSLKHTLMTNVTLVLKYK